MFCPSCGAPNNQPDQRYCQDCGATLPANGGLPGALAKRSPANLPTSGRTGRTGMLGLIPVDTRNRMLVGAGVAVAAVVILYVLLSAIVHFLFYVALPVVIVIAVLYGGYRLLRAKTS